MNSKKQIEQIEKIDHSYFDLTEIDEQMKALVLESISTEIAQDRFKFFLAKPAFYDFYSIDNKNISEKEQIETREYLESFGLKNKLSQMVMRLSKEGISWARVYKFKQANKPQIAVPFKVIPNWNPVTDELESCVLMFFQNIGSKSLIRVEQWNLFSFTTTYEFYDKKEQVVKKDTDNYLPNNNKIIYHNLKEIPIIKIMNYDNSDLGLIPISDLANADIEINQYTLALQKLGFYLKYYNPAVLGKVDASEGRQAGEVLLDLKEAHSQPFKILQNHYGTAFNVPGQADTGSTVFLDVDIKQIQYILDTTKNIKHKILEMAKTTTDIDGAGKAQKNDAAVRSNRQNLELHIQHIETELNTAASKIIKWLQYFDSKLPNDKKVKIIFQANLYKNRNDVAERQLLLQEFQQTGDVISFLKERNSIPESLAIVEAKMMKKNIEKYSLKPEEKNNEEEDNLKKGLTDDILKKTNAELEKETNKEEKKLGDK